MKQFVKNTNDCARVRIDQNTQQPSALSVVQSAPQMALKKHAFARSIPIASCVRRSNLEQKLS
jgi:hypothetical protein